jgi:hypothetical protein
MQQPLQAPNKGDPHLRPPVVAPSVTFDLFSKMLCYKQCKQILERMMDAGFPMTGGERFLTQGARHRRTKRL